MDQLRLLGPEAFAVLDRAAVKRLVLACHDSSPTFDRPETCSVSSSLRGFLGASASAVS